MKFTPSNPVVKRSLLGMEKEEKGQLAEAGKIFQQAWEEATNAFEKFLAAYYVARTRENATDKLSWLEKALENAQKADSEIADSAFPNLYNRIAKCYEELGDPV